jgi:D-alanine-D-alanine ligase-like ATP-grasp enzyme
MTQADSPCVVKPTGGASGSGTTTGVRTREQLLRARLRGARVSRRLLIERQAEGDMYRLLFMDGELLDTVRRRPPRVTGDGRATIRELIAAENARRLDPEHPVSMPILRVDLDCLFTLEAAGLGLESVLPEGQTLAVKTVTSQNRIEDNETVREPISPDLVEEAREAAAQVGVRLAGIDLITRDLSRSLKKSGGVIIEVNGTPGLHYHYQVADEANATPVAVPILRRLLDIKE